MAKPKGAVKKKKSKKASAKPASKPTSKKRVRSTAKDKYQQTGAPWWKAYL
jgi:hypothetical protein